MNRRAPIPFDPDAHHGSGVIVHAAPEPSEGGMMLSEVIDAEHWHGDGGDVEHVEPDTLKGAAQPMSKHQKWKLSELAESVYRLLKAEGQLAGETLKGFRGRIAVAACGRRISQACHGDWRAIQDGFIAAKQGLDVKRADLTSREATALAIAKHKLWELCTKTRTPRQAVETISRRFYKGAGIAELTTARQVWAVFYTVQNNANAAAGVGSKENRFKNKRRKSA